MTDVAPQRLALPSKTEQRILVAARECFESLGIAKTTVVDIAAAAGYSRPMIYKYFSDKTEIVDRVCMEEMQAIQTVLNARISRNRSFADVMIETIMLGVVLARDNLYIRRFIEDHASWVRAQTSSSQVHHWVADRWGDFLSAAKARGEFAPDLDIDETVIWISLIQSLLLLRYENEKIDQATLKRLVSRFAVAPLLSRAPPAPSA